MTSLSDRTERTERSLGLAARVGDPHVRQLQEVALVLIDGSEIRGMLHRAHGTRTLDYLNRGSESFVAMTDATVTQRGGETEYVSFVAVNKAHVVRLVETSDAD
jgi:hypothetical protein